MGITKTDFMRGMPLAFVDCTDKQIVIRDASELLTG